MQHYHQIQSHNVNGMLWTLLRSGITWFFSLESDVARYKALLHKESGAWLTVLQSKNNGTLWDNNAFRISIALRLGCNICSPRHCIYAVPLSMNLGFMAFKLFSERWSQFSTCKLQWHHRTGIQLSREIGTWRALQRRWESARWNNFGSMVGWTSFGLGHYMQRHPCPF